MEGKASDWRPGPTVCRCCLTEGCYKDISTEYFWMGKREVYAEMLSDTLNISISFSKSGGPNSNSRLICEPCISRLRDASEFKRQVIDCEKTFMHHLDPGSSSKVQEFTVDLIGEVKVEKVKREKESNSDDDFDDRPDFLDIDTDDDLDDQPLTKLASKIPKKETVDILDLLDNSQITVKRKSNVKLKAPPKKIVKKKEAVAKPSASKPTPPKQTEKKKDDEWTTTDASDNNVINAHTHTSRDEWVTTDSKDAAQTLVKVERSGDIVPDEWVTTDFTNTVKIEYAQDSSDKANSKIENEWAISDATKTENEIINSKMIINTQCCVKQDVKTSLKIEANTSLLSPNIRSQPQKEAVAKRGDKMIWARVGQKMVKIVVGGDNGSDPAFDIVKPQKRLARRKAPGVINKAVIADATDGVKTLTKYQSSKLAGQIKRDRRFVDKKHLENARLIVQHTTAIPIRIQLTNIDVPCFACLTKFEDPFVFRDHFLAEHKNVDKTKGMHLYNNVQTRVDITDLACTVCSQLLDTLDDAARHLVQEHKVNIDLEDRLGLVPLKFPQAGQYICAVCPRKCLSFRDLYRHSGSHFPFHVCEICGKKFESSPSLRSHLSRKHVEGHPCRNCKTAFSTVPELRQHVKDGCTGIKCKICNLPFAYSQALQKHRETVHGAPKRIYKCSECLKVFEKRMQLYFHTKKEHTDHHKCLHCGKNFTDSSSLKKHMLVHTDERPYKCHICQQAFKNRSYYKTHITKCKV